MTSKLITTNQLDMAQIMLWLADNQLPNANTFLLPGSVGPTLIEQETWQALPYLTGWSDFGGGFQSGQYALDSLGFVHLRGLTAHPTAYTFPAAICTLPPGARPAAPELFDRPMIDATTGLVIAVIQVRQDGAVFAQSAVPTPSGTGAIDLALSGITFKAGG